MEAYYCWETNERNNNNNTKMKLKESFQVVSSNFFPFKNFVISDENILQMNQNIIDKTLCVERTEQLQQQQLLQNYHYKVTPKSYSE
jgi:hypothetical protein